MRLEGVLRTPGRLLTIAATRLWITGLGNCPPILTPMLGGGSEPLLVYDGTSPPLGAVRKTIPRPRLAVFRTVLPH